MNVLERAPFLWASSALLRISAGYGRTLRLQPSSASDLVGTALPLNHVMRVLLVRCTSSCRALQRTTRALLGPRWSSGLKRLHSTWPLPLPLIILNSMPPRRLATLMAQGRAAQRPSVAASLVKNRVHR
ncbi:hypothetical protein GQ53DRAFT_229940 [Thozetella sp. PMI_491]|nr:hypothetical protein GQ53DRAFT_229940 [Thozetella sp. PMI_491]